MNGHLLSMIHSKRKIAEQLCFSIDVCQTIGMLSNRLIEVETDQTLSFLRPMSSFILRRSDMSLITPGTYSIGPLQSVCLNDEEACAIAEFTNQGRLSSFKKLYHQDTIFYTSQFGGKSESSICSFVINGAREYGSIQKFILLPPTVLIKPFQKSTSSFLKSAGNPARSKLCSYIQADLLSAFIIQVENGSQPICAIPISSILKKCIRISLDDSEYSYIISIPNNFEHH